MQRFEYPSWHDKARRMSEEGLKKEAIADHFHVSLSSIGKVLSASWKAYLLFHRDDSNRKKSGIHKKATQYSNDASNYEFVPVDAYTDPHLKKFNGVAFKAQKYMEEEMKPRHFDSAKKFENGLTYQGARIVCSQCGKSEDYFAAHGSVNPNYIGKHFIGTGWVVGGNIKTDRCPECAAKFRPVAHKTKEMPSVKSFKELALLAKRDVTVNVNGAVQHHDYEAEYEHPVTDLPKIPDIGEPVFEPVPEPVVEAKPVPEFGKIERRVIFAKLNDVYVDENVGYSTDWNDAKVAADLGVPLEWVATVRDADFGPEISSASREQATKQLREMIETNERLITLIDKKYEMSLALDDKIDKIIEQTEVTFQMMQDHLRRFNELKAAQKVDDNHMQDLIDKYLVNTAEFKKIADELKPITSAK